MNQPRTLTPREDLSALLKTLVVQTRVVVDVNCVDCENSHRLTDFEPVEFIDHGETASGYVLSDLRSALEDFEYTQDATGAWRCRYCAGQKGN